MGSLNESAGKLIVVKKLEPIIVRPATRTFNGLYFLSNLDQTFPYPIEIVFTFKGGDAAEGRDTNTAATQVIRESLEKILVEFYPFAGRLTASWDGKFVVSCTGEGVPFVEATADCGIDVLGDITILDPVKLRELVHYVDGAQNILDIPLLTVQVTKFKCGGIVLGVAFNHILIDGRSFTDFLACWTEIARGIPVLSTFPFLDRSIFHPRQPLKIDTPHHEYITNEISRNTIPPLHRAQEQFVYRSFCFNPAKLNQLKKMVAAAPKEDQYHALPTSFEIISALVWINRTKALKIKSNETTKILTAVDGRPKFNPAMPKGYFGNGIVWSCAQRNVGELTESPFSVAVKIVQEAIKEVKEEYIRSSIDYYEVTRAGLETKNTCWITKWSRLPFYDANFGWGEPAQVAPASTVDDLILSLSQGKGNKNIVVSLGLPSSAMAIFEELIYAELSDSN